MEKQEVILMDSKLTLKEFIERFDKEQVVVLPTKDLASYKLKKQESKKKYHHKHTRTEIYSLL